MVVNPSHQSSPVLMSYSQCNIKHLHRMKSLAAHSPSFNQLQLHASLSIKFILFLSLTTRPNPYQHLWFSLPVTPLIIACFIQWSSPLAFLFSHWYDIVFCSFSLHIPSQAFKKMDWIIIFNSTISFSSTPLLSLTAPHFFLFLRHLPSSTPLFSRCAFVLSFVARLLFNMHFAYQCLPHFSFVFWFVFFANQINQTIWSLSMVLAIKSGAYASAFLSEKSALVMLYCADNACK